MKLYNELAQWWPLLSDPADYADEAAAFHRHFAAHSPPPQTLLDLGSGGGNNALHLKQHYRLTLVDLSPAMLDVSRALNPDCEHIQGDMRTVRLGRRFDGVFVHDAVAYMTTEADLRRAILTAAEHCRPGGIVLLVPDATTETFTPYTETGGHDGDGRALRYLEWTYDPDPADTTCVTDFVYMLREGADTVQVEQERHLFGLFPRSRWIQLMEEAGLAVRTEMDQYQRELFIGSK